MHAEVIDDQLSRISRDLKNRGLTYEELREDILDHICCMVEEEMESGKDFNTSYREVMSYIDDRTLPNLQHQTLLLLDEKFQKMKKITYVLGLTGSILAIVGAIFKTMHWPGASILMLLGFMTVVLVFLPMYFIGSYKEQAEKPNVIYPIVGYLSLLFVFTGAVFKIMHWPGAGWIIRISIILLLVGFLPLYIVQIFKRSSDKSKINPAYIIMLIVGVSIVLILSRVNLSKYSIDRYTELTKTYDASVAMLKERIDGMIEQAPDSLITTDVKKAITMAEALEAKAEQMLGGLLEEVNQLGVPIEKVERRDYKYAGRDAFYDNGLSEKFLNDCSTYKNFLIETVSDPLIDNQVEIELIFTEGDWMSGWDPSDYIYEPLIVNYYKITVLKRAVVHVEYLALKELLK